MGWNVSVSWYVGVAGRGRTHHCLFLGEEECSWSGLKWISVAVGKGCIDRAGCSTLGWVAMSEQWRRVGFVQCFLLQTLHGPLVYLFRQAP